MLSVIRLPFFIQLENTFQVKMKFVFVLFFVTFVVGLEPNDECVQVAKVELCNKYHKERECYQKLNPYYNHVSVYFSIYN